MVITKFAIGRDAASGANLPFAMTFQRARIVRAEETEIHASSADQAGRTADMGPTGRQSAPREDFVARVAFDDYASSGGRRPTAEEFAEITGRTPEQHAALFRGEG